MITSANRAAIAQRYRPSDEIGLTPHRKMDRSSWAVEPQILYLAEYYQTVPHAVGHTHTHRLSIDVSFVVTFNVR